MLTKIGKETGKWLLSILMVLLWATVYLPILMIVCLIVMCLGFVFFGYFGLLVAFGISDLTEVMDETTVNNDPKC